MGVMNPRVTLVAVVCLAVFAFTAIAGIPMFALIDALTPVDALFAYLVLQTAPLAHDVALPASPVRDLSSPRAPPVRLAYPPSLA